MLADFTSHRHLTNIQSVTRPARQKRPGYFGKHLEHELLALSCGESDM